ncbi:MAG: peroxiredoxin, partial [Kiloniellales bacterium]
MSVMEGNPAPDFTVPSDGGGTISLAALRGRPVVLYFYPKDDTPGCTMESCGFRDSLPDFDRLDATVIGISRDDVGSHERFKAKYGLTFPLAADVDGTVCEAYGSWVQKSMYGRLYMGIDRSTFLIDENGVVRRVWRGVKVGGHVDEVLGALQELKGLPVTPPRAAPA